MKKNGFFGKLTKVGLGGAATVAAYQWIIKPWHLRWGATEAEAQGQFPGDDVVKNPTQLSTRAVTIDALPEEIWPWLVQMGQGRGGAYSYDWIENLMGLDIHSANRIIPELQTLEVGDTIPLEPGGTGLLVERMEPNKYLLLKYPDGGMDVVLRFESTGQNPYTPCCTKSLDDCLFQVRETRVVCINRARHVCHGTEDAARHQEKGRGVHSTSCLMVLSHG